MIYISFPTITVLSYIYWTPRADPFLVWLVQHERLQKRGCCQEKSLHTGQERTKSESQPQTAFQLIIKIIKSTLLKEKFREVLISSESFNASLKCLKFSEVQVPLFYAKKSKPIFSNKYLLGVICLFFIQVSLKRIRIFVAKVALFYAAAEWYYTQGAWHLHIGQGIVVWVLRTALVAC